MCICPCVCVYFCVCVCVYARVCVLMYVGMLMCVGVFMGVGEHAASCRALRLRQQCLGVVSVIKALCGEGDIPGVRRRTRRCYD